ncbi:Phosphotyrosyl phosphatase activator [Trachipleistophora hominis]|uniref:Serine/threonine-protein phosphatase 2A activator n=1 Tax=Trachipleistophora hominis TaxID=72359 RepID=L7JZK7_TRAHO|nr:Phosphotyrosyl phosphatase activator [Trachipleistophora hominis]
MGNDPADSFLDEKNKFRYSPAYTALSVFLGDINENIRERSYKQDPQNFVILLLNKIDDKIQNTPLNTGPQRFANCAVAEVYEFIESVPLDFGEFTKVSEDDRHILHVYLDQSFGSKHRFDYGTGHELFFLSFLYVCNQLGILSIYDMEEVFQRYFQVVRNLIYRFNLEPAGSHGPWVIDDYHFMPFLFGSAQLIDTKLTFTDLFKKENAHLLYSEAVLFCIKHKCRFVKTDFKKHSAALYSIKDIDWKSINERIMEMIEEEVMGRDVVTQHFIYSKYLKALNK